jgi:geranylgeranyl diphosphate synthase type I
VHLEEYIDMVLRKTGALFGCALELGALSAGAEPALQEEFRRLGRALGIAYQLRDDVLGVWGAAVKTGKPAASDVLHQKKSLPFVLAAIAASRAEFEELCAAYARADVGAALGLFEGLGVRRLCEEQISGKTAEAAALLRGLRISAKGSAEMKEAADFLLQRDY